MSLTYESSPRGVEVARDAVPPLLDGLAVRLTGNAALPVSVCAEHLALLGAARETVGTGGADRSRAGHLSLRPTGHQGALRAGEEIECAIGWLLPSRGEPDLPGCEAVVQALTGLMAVHGRDQSIPRRLGLGVASVAAGIIASQGVLAALIARSRGCP